MSLASASKATFQRWLEDPTTWIGVFENKALDSADCGMRFALAFDVSNLDDATIGETRAPDTAMGMGWRYLLVAKCASVEEVMEAMQFEDW